MKIGKRVLKTSFAVLISCLIYIVLMLIDKGFGLDRSLDAFAPSNWYTPFFGGIAAAYAVQSNPERSINQAQIRSFGSLIGGTFGAIIIHIYEEAYLLITKIESIDLVLNYMPFRLIEYVFVSLGIILLIPLTVNLKRKNAVFISCLTYLSVTISIRNGGMDVFFFSFNRILSTIIGVQVALIVNDIDKLKHKNKEILFISSVASNKYTKDAKMSPFGVYEINNLVHLGCDMVFVNDRTLTALASSLKDLKLENPVLLLNGLVSYDNKDRSYLANAEIDPLSRADIEKILNDTKSPYFTYQVNDSRFNCYFKELSNDGIKSYYNKRVDNTHYTFSKAIAPADMGILLYYVIDKENKVKEILNKLKNLSFYNKLDVQIEKSESEGYFDLKIRPNSVDSSKLIDDIYKKHNSKYKIAFVTKDTVNDAYNADFKFCYKFAPLEVQEKCNYVITSNDPDFLLKFIYKIYFKRNYRKYLDKIKIR